MGSVTFNQTTVVNVTTTALILLPVSMNCQLWPNQADGANGVSTGALALGGVIYDWGGDTVIPPNYACAITTMTPQGGVMQCYSVGTEEIDVISVAATATGERGDFPER